MFADDTKVYCVGNNGYVAVSILNRALRELYEWCLINRLTPHPKKYEAMFMARSNYIGPIAPVSYGGSLITWIEKSRLLGVTVDKKLTWSPHLSEVKKTFASKLNLLRKSSFFFSNECNGKFFCKCYSGICHLQSGHLDKQQSFRAIRDAGESTQSQEGLFMI